MKLVNRCIGCLVFLSLVIPLSISPAEAQGGMAQSSGQEAEAKSTKTQQAAAQPSGEVSTRFEVVSVRLSSPGGMCTINNSGSPRFSVHNATMRLLVGLAFGISTQKITHAPSWFDTQLYDVNAKAEGEAPLTPRQFQPLVQQFLKDRFQFAAHKETVYQPGYALVIAKNGPRLQASKPDSQTGYILPDGLNFASITPEGLAGVMASVSGSPVVDKTGVKGEYSVELKYAPRDATDSDFPSFFTALEDELGLKLVSEKRVPVETLVIDHVERVPTEN